MRRFILSSAMGLAAAAMISGAAEAQLKIQGSGASFPANIYNVWMQEYSKANPDVRMDYQSKGSGAGIQDFTNNIVQFAASDAAMNDDEVAAVDGNVVMLPMTAGEIVLAYNLEGVDELKLPRDVYPEIFAGTITKWNDPKIAEANEGVELPDQNITVVTRSDSSGTTFVFTKHLSTVSETFAKIGEGKTVQWPSLPTFIKAPKNDGITATIVQTPGAIGYIEYGYAVATGSTMALLENASGEFIAPGGEAGSAALASADFSSGDMRVWVSDPDTSGAYPIATFTWMLFYKKNESPEVAEALRNFIEWAVTDGQQFAEQTGYIPLPEVVANAVIEASAEVQ